LPAQPGVGRIALGATRAKVIPVFVLGMGQTIRGEWKMNFTTPDKFPVDVYFGDPIDFADLRPKANMLTTQKRAADRCLDGIKALAEQQRRDAARRDGKDPDADAPVASRPPLRIPPQATP
jgi:1-acyl-sn-glycerol-3-phosphate acyltransferase